MRVRHKGLVNTELNVLGEVVKSDARGVFEVPEHIGMHLKKMPGYYIPVESEELSAAYDELHTAETELAAAQRKLEAVRQRVTLAEQQHDDTTPAVVDEPKPKPSKKKSAPPPPPSEEEDDEPEPEESDEDEEEEVAAPAVNEKAQQRLIAKHDGHLPSMSWKQPDLVKYAVASGIPAQREWSKAQILGELEALED